MSVSPSSPVAADVNFDGRADLITGAAIATQVSTLLGSPSGFAAPIDSPSSVDSRVIAVADLTLDGFADVVSISPNATTVLVQGGAADGTFSSGATGFSTPTGGTPSNLTLGDFDGDGDLDVVISIASSNRLGFIRNLGIGLAPVANTNANQNPQGIVADDFDLDGKLDAVTAGAATFDVAFFKGKGNGTFDPFVATSTGVPASWLAKGDLNGDLVPDLVLSSQLSASVRYFLGQGTASFGAVNSVPTPAIAAHVSLSDVDSDGQLDAIVTHSVTQQVSLLRSAPGAPLSILNTFTPLADATAATAIDGDGDGILDLALTCNNARCVEVLRAKAPGQFEAATSVALPAVPSALRLSDVNADGSPDIAALTTAGGNGALTIETGNGLGGFPNPPSVTPIGPDAKFVIITDVDADAKPDALSCSASLNQVSVLKNMGGGAFAPNLTIPVPGAPQAAALSDLNGDGIGDLAVVVQTSFGSSIESLLGNGGGFTVGAAPGAVFGNPQSIAAADINLDGMLDLVTPSDSAPGFVGLLLGIGSGQFLSPFNIAAGDVPSAITVGELNGDGRPDVLLTNRTATGGVIVMLGDAAVLLGAATTYGTELGTPAALGVADMNGDLKLDCVATSSKFVGSVAVFRGDGAGALVPSGEFAAGLNPTSLALSDIDADGRTDVIAGAVGSASASVLLSTDTLPPTSFNFGVGTPGCRGRIGMRALGTPKIGQSMSMQASNAPPSSLGLGIISDVVDVAGSDPLFLNAQFHVGLFGAVILIPVDMVSDAGGVGLMPYFTLPNNPSLVGSAIFYQSFWAPKSFEGDTCSPALFELQSSVGLGFVIL